MAEYEQQVQTYYHRSVFHGLFLVAGSDQSQQSIQQFAWETAERCIFRCFVLLFTVSPIQIAFLAPLNKPN